MCQPNCFWYVIHMESNVQRQDEQRQSVASSLVVVTDRLKIESPFQLSLINLGKTSWFRS